MDFGYFTLSDNHYLNNRRSANEFIENILAEAVYADELGMHSAWIGEHCFQYLDAPILRCASLDTAIPMNKALEDEFLAKARLTETIDKLLKY